MKKLITFTALTVFSFNLHASDMDPFASVGRPIKSTLKDQVCQLASGSDVCTGVRISENLVLTAAHCVRDTANGKLKSVSVSCDNSRADIESIHESKTYVATAIAQSKIKRDKNDISSKPTDDLTDVDFAVIKIKKMKASMFSKPKKFISSAKLLKNLDEYKSILLNSSGSNSYKFAVETVCETHGYGYNDEGELDVYKAARIDSTTMFDEKPYYMYVYAKDNTAYLNSPFLPENTKKTVTPFTSLRPGDSGGPLFCKARSGEWIIAGIASSMFTGDCPSMFQEGQKTIEQLKAAKETPRHCYGSSWGVPSKETLESALQIKLDI